MAASNVLDSLNLEEGMRLRSRVLASPFVQNKGRLEDESLSNLSGNVRQNSIPDNPDIRPVFMGQSPDNLRIEGNENRNAFSLPNRKLVREFEQEISPVTRPKSVTVVPTEKVRSTSSDEKSADEINVSKENIRRLNSNDKLALFEQMLDENPDFAPTLMNKIRTSRQCQLSKNNSTDRINPFAENLPYPPNLDRRNNSKTDTFAPMSKRNYFENNSFVDMGDRTSGLPYKTGTRFCEPQTETQHVQSGLPRGVRRNIGQGSVDHGFDGHRLQNQNPNGYFHDDLTRSNVMNNETNSFQQDFNRHFHVPNGPYQGEYGNPNLARQGSGGTLPPVLERGAGFDAFAAQNQVGNDQFSRGNFRDRQTHMDFPRTFDNSREFRRHQFSPRSENNNFSREGGFAKIKPPTFNGSYEEWPYFKRLFLEASSLNGWGRQQKLYNLLNSLQGDARTFIISMEGQLSHLSFEDLLQLMESRFGVGDRSTHFQSLLEGRTWKWGDNLRTYQDEIRRLVSLAFPEVQGWNHQEVLVKKYFINGIMDQQIKQKLLIDPPTTLEGAVQYCERFVAAKAAVEGNRRPFLKQEKVRMVRPYEEEEEEEEEEEDLVDEVVNLLRSKGFSSKSRDMKNFKCYNCGMKGHMRKHCRVKCANCGGLGHQEKDCPSPNLNERKSPSEAKRGTQQTMANQPSLKKKED